MNSKIAKNIFNIVSSTGITDSAFSKNPSLKKKFLNCIKTNDDPQLFNIVANYEKIDNRDDRKIIARLISCLIIALYNNTTYNLKHQTISGICADADACSKINSDFYDLSLE